eukprot:CAMPEP_0115540392 /NCGR_PEP_ID=MMETSP0271-20121206/89902_1 /TAXON_ID=71861 /ORGANISM="Scrippsiella trochoidea, Strain CCMP3099" /LENGTH=68 /DNA_ID=CAMNT_0002973381 /DNA_START=214 /DNA_END=420 /DNA_ORIENTATION=-
MAVPALSQSNQESRPDQQRPCKQERILGACMLHCRCDDAVPHFAVANRIYAAHNFLCQLVSLLLSAEL